MKIDFFSHPASDKTDKSDWIASLTCLNPVLNGGIATYMTGYSYDQDRFVSPKNGGSFRDAWFVEGCKVFAVLQNLSVPGQTLNKPPENIKRVIIGGSNSDKREIVYEFGMQPYLFFDFNNENIGHNRREGESVRDYVRRVMKSDILYESKDYAFAEFCPVHMKETNTKINSSMNNNTYYFSYAAGIKNKNKMKARELLHEPKRISKLGLGFDLDIDQYLDFSEKDKKTTRRS